MKITEQKKCEYWNHFVAAFFVEGLKYFGVTGPRLRKIKPIIWADKVFWFDILRWHSGSDMSPEQMIAWDEEIYGHCQGNFWGMVMQTMVEEGMVQ